MTTLSIEHLRVEWLADPTAIHTLTPRLSWEIRTDLAGVVQCGYRVLVASSPDRLARNEGDLWDTGVVDSSAQNGILYAGKALASFTRCHWKVCVVVDAESHCWSIPARWDMAILDPTEWKGALISMNCEGVKDASFFRREFSPSKPVTRAMLYVTARGICEVFINGSAVSDELFTPGWTNYKKRHYYRAYDVTALLHEQVNCLGGILGEGWYKGAIGYKGSNCIYGSRTALLINLRLEYADGTVETVATGDGWKTRFGPIQQSSFLFGENYDARMALDGWSQPGYDDRAWEAARVIAFDSKQWENGAGMVSCSLPLEPHPAPPIRRLQEFPACSSWPTLPGSVVFDIGRNIAGRVRLKVKGKPGQMVRLRFGEVLNPDRTLYVENLRSASSTDTYIIRSADEEVWEPRFTFHGFQYVEVTGLDKTAVDTVTGIAIGTDVTRTGTFRCSNDDINRLYDNTYWTQRANFIEVPTDCPQRDERLGWTGDALAFVKTAAYNTDIASFYAKWLTDLRDTQREDGSIANIAPAAICTDDKADAAWGDALVGCPWTLYQFYGDTRVLRENFEAMKGLLRYYADTADNFIRRETFTFGDWLSHNAPTLPEVIKTAYFAHSAEIVSKVAKVLGETEDEAFYRTLSADIKIAFNREFVGEDGTIKGETQTAYLLGLGFDLLPEALREKAKAHLVADIEARGGKLSTGFIGTSLLLPVLSRCGCDEVAYGLLLQDEYPSWLFPIRNGATSIWERWNGWTPEAGPGDSGMNSYSHYALGAVVEWLYRTVAGIEMLKPGFEEILIRPVSGGGLSWAECSYQSIRGKIVSRWKIENGNFELNVTIPPNTTATVTLPGPITTGIDSTATQATPESVKVGPGTFCFTCSLVPTEE